MKVNKPTTILLNVILILLVALLIKTLIAFPKSAYGQKGPSEYMIQYKSGYGIPGEEREEAKAAQDFMNMMAKKGWRYHSEFSERWIVFER